MYYAVHIYEEVLVDAIANLFPFGSHRREITTCSNVRRRLGLRDLCTSIAFDAGTGREKTLERRRRIGPVRPTAIGTNAAGITNVLRPTLLFSSVPQRSCTTRARLRPSSSPDPATRLLINKKTRVGIPSRPGGISTSGVPPGRYSFSRTVASCVPPCSVRSGMDVRMAGSRMAVARRFGQDELVITTTTNSSSSKSNSTWVLSTSGSNGENVSHPADMFPNTRPFSFPNCV